MANENSNPQPPRQLWPHLPRQLIRLIEKEENPLYSKIAHKGVTKSWCFSSSAAGPSCNNATNSVLPWLQLVDHDSDDQRYLYNLGFKSDACSLFEKPRKLRFYFSQCANGELLHVGPPRLGEDTNHRLWDPLSGAFRCLARWDTKDPFLSIHLPAGNKNSGAGLKAMVLTGVSRPALAFYRHRKEDWNDPQGWTAKLDCEIADPHSTDPSAASHLMQFTNGIWFQKKFYALSLQGTLAVVEEIDSGIQITSLGKNRAVPSGSSAGSFRECLIKFGGEVLLIFLVSSDAATSVVSDVEVYKLDTAELAWIKKDSLGDVTVFWGSNCCMPVSASKVGCKRNCVYFTQPSSLEEWWVYEMETGTIAPGWNDPNSRDKSPVWAIPK